MSHDEEKVLLLKFAKAYDESLNKIKQNKITKSSLALTNSYFENKNEIEKNNISTSNFETTKDYDCIRREYSKFATEEMMKLNPGQLHRCEASGCYEFGTMAQTPWSQNWFCWKHFTK